MNLQIQEECATPPLHSPEKTGTWTDIHSGCSKQPRSGGRVRGIAVPTRATMDLALREKPVHCAVMPFFTEASSTSILVHELTRHVEAGSSELCRYAGGRGSFPLGNAAEEFFGRLIYVRSSRMARNLLCIFCAFSCLHSCSRFCNTNSSYAAPSIAKDLFVCCCCAVLHRETSVHGLCIWMLIFR